MSVKPAAILPIVMSRRAPCFLSTRNPMKGMMGSDINRNTVIEEKVARETFRAWLMGIMKNASPYPVSPALIMLLRNVTATMTQP